MVKIRNDSKINTHRIVFQKEKLEGKSELPSDHQEDTLEIPVNLEILTWSSSFFNEIHAQENPSHEIDLSAFPYGIKMLRLAIDFCYGLPFSL